MLARAAVGSGSELEPLAPADMAWLFLGC
jgi:hypothetical protein